jgi:hypothetical protein
LTITNYRLHILDPPLRRNWLFIGSHTALGTGLGWTIRGCNKGALTGDLIGGGGSGNRRAKTQSKIAKATDSSSKDE